MAENPCWEGYEQIGMKMKNGKKVPNCVPIKRAKQLTTLEEQVEKIKSAALALVAEANSTFSGTRVVTKGVALKIVERSLARTEGQTYSLRKHQALTELTHFISLLQTNKTLGDKSLNADLLPIGHPESSRRASVSVASMLKARARWISDDPQITDDSVKTLIASAFTAHPASAEYEYTITRLSALPEGSLPQYALLAALGDGNSSAARRARAMRQRRDRKGRFAEMGGGLRALIRRLDGSVRWLTGSPVSQGDDGAFTVELPDGRLVKIPAEAGEGVKAFIPSKRSGDGYSEKPANYSAKDPVLDEASLETVDAPDGFRVDDSWSPSADDQDYYGTKIDLGTKYTDDAYDVIKFEPGDNAAVRDKFEAVQQRENEGQNAVADGKGEDGWIDYSKPVYFVQRRGDDEGRPFAAVQSWADVQDLIAQDEPRFEAGELADPSRAGVDDDGDTPAKTAPDKVPGAKSPEVKKGEKLTPEDVEKAGGTFIPGGPDAPDYQVRAYEKALKKYRKNGGDIPVDPRKRWGAFPDGTVVDIDTGEILRDSEGRVFIPEEKEPLVKEKKTLFGKKKIAKIPAKDVPKSYHPVDKETPYEPEGRIDGAESTDATDDPVELAQKFDTPTLKKALEEAVSGTDESPATGTAPLEFDKGDEMVPAEAIYDALKTKESEAEAAETLDKVYEEGAKSNPKKLYAEDATPADAPEKVSPEVEAEIGKDLPTPATPDFDPTDVELPALLEGLGPDEKREYLDGGDYAKWLPADKTFTDVPEGYSVLDSDPYVDIPEAYPADAPTGFSTSPVDMSLSFTPQGLKDALRQALEPNGERPGQGMLAFETPEGEAYTAWVPGEALRDALKLQGIDTDEFIDSVYAEGREGKKEPSESEAKAVLDEVIADETPAAEAPTAEDVVEGERKTPAKLTIGEEVYIPEVGWRKVKDIRKIVTESSYAGRKPTTRWLVQYDNPDGTSGSWSTTPFGGSWGEKTDNKLATRPAREDAPTDAPESEASGVTAEEALLTEPEGPKTEDPITDLSLVTPTTEMHAGIFRGTPDMLRAGDIAFKDDPEREYFVIESVEKGTGGMVNVKGYYIGHESGDKTWKKTTPITFIRGEKDVPAPGDKPALDRPFAKDYGKVLPSEDSPSGWLPTDPEAAKKFLEDYKAFEDAKAESGRSFTPSIDTETTSVVPLMEPQAPRYPMFYGERMKALLAEAGGDYEKLKELIKAEEVYHLDFETVGDGFSDNPTPIQIAIYKMKDGERVGEPIVRFMNPDKPLASFYTDADPATILKDADGNPISDEWLAKQPPVAEVMKEIFDILGPNPLFVAHNAAFDGLILEQHAKRLGVEWNPSSIDTLAIAEEVIPVRGQRNLKAVAKRYGIEDRDWHDAAVDAEVLPEILDGLLTDLAAKDTEGKGFDYDAAAGPYDERKAEFDAMLEEYQKYSAERAMAEAWAKMMDGKETPSLEEVVADAKLKPSTPTVDELTPATEKPEAPLSKTKFESILGGDISNEWIEDDENTTSLGPIKPFEMLKGDFIASEYGGWVEIRDIKQNEENEKMLDITLKSVTDGREKTYTYFKYGKKRDVRRRNGSIVEAEATKPVEPVETELPAAESVVVPEAPSAASPASPPPPPPEGPKIFFDGDMSDWKEFTPSSGATKGSSEGMFMRAPDGKEYYVKKPKSEEHARNEVLASALYEKMGIKHGRSYLADKDGELVIVSPLIEGAEYNFSSRRGEDDIAKSALDGFVVDAWLNNWDSVGGGFDNMIIKDGEVYRIDAGGSMFFRARGGDKKSTFTPEVTSLDSLRDRGRNPQAAAVFGKITDDEIRAQAEKLGSLTDADIDAIVNAAINDPEDSETYKSALKARRDDILSKYGVEKTEAPEAPEEVTSPEAAEVSGPVSEGTKSAISKTTATRDGDAETALRTIVDSEDSTPEEKAAAETILKKISDAKSEKAPKELDPSEKAASDLLAPLSEPVEPEVDETPATPSTSRGLTPDDVREDAEIDDEELSEILDGVVESPDEILKKIFSKYKATNNGDGTFTITGVDRKERGSDKRYEVVVRKNKDNTFSVLYREIDPDTGAVIKDTDPYVAKHSFTALDNTIKRATDTLAKYDASIGAIAPRLREIERRSKARKTAGTPGTTPTRSVKMTHPSADGVNEVKYGDRVWDPKRGEWATVVDVIKEHRVKRKDPVTGEMRDYIYTDYVRVEFDSGGKGVRMPSGRLWIADKDGKVSSKALAVPAPAPKAKSTKKTSVPDVTDPRGGSDDDEPEEPSTDGDSKEAAPVRAESYRPMPLPKGLTEEELVDEIGKRIKEAKKFGTPMGVEIPEGMSPSQFMTFLRTHEKTFGLRSSDIMKFQTAVNYISDFKDSRKKVLDAMSDEDKATRIRITDEIRDRGAAVVAVPSRVLDQVLESGRFKSQFETGSSRGMLDPGRRATFEVAGFDVHPSMAKKLRPIYGHIRATDADGRITAPDSFQYGDIFFELKESAKDRATFTAGDSLYAPYRPVPLTGDVSDEQKLEGWVGRYGKRIPSTTKLDDLVSGHDYIEMQVLGGLNLDEIEVVHMKEPDSAYKREIYQKLINAGFTVKFTK